MKNNLNIVMDKVVDIVIQSTENVNISDSERIVSAASGSFMLWKGLKDTFSNPSNALWEIVIGGALLYRGVTGYCSVKNKLNSLKEMEQPTYLIESM